MTYTKFHTIEQELRVKVKERDDEIRCALVALLAKGHFIMAGPPGTGKTFLSRSVFQRVLNARTFEKDLHEATIPEEVYGPLNVKDYVENGQFERKIDGRLADTEFAMLDEFFNANRPVLHSIMPLLNERVFSHGSQHIPVPLRSAIMGTNKLFGGDPELMAVWDRIHLRTVVDYIRDPQSRMDMAVEALARLASNGRGTSTIVNGEQFTTVTLEELDAAHTEVLALDVPDAVLVKYRDLAEELRAEGIVISDRRFAECWPLVLANAYLNGHGTVDTTDLDILIHSWWTDLENKDKAYSIITESVNPLIKEIVELSGNLSELDAEMDAVLKDDPARRPSAIQNIIRNLGIVDSKINALGSDDTRVQKLTDRSANLRSRVLAELGVG